MHFSSSQIRTTVPLLIWFSHQKKFSNLKELYGEEMVTDVASPEGQLPLVTTHLKELCGEEVVIVL